MKRSEISNRERKVTIRLQQSEFDLLVQRFNSTTCRKLSEYLRDVLLNKPITVRHRNQSADEFLSVALKIKKELLDIGSNHNQVVKKMHLLQDKNDLFAWMAEQERIQRVLMEKVKEISESMNEIYQIWLQK